MDSVAKDRGDAAFKARDFSGAIRHYTDAISQDSSQAKLFSNRSAAYLAVRDYIKALDDAERAIELDGSFAKAHGRKGDALLQLQRPSDALDAFREALRLDPGNANYRTKRDAAQQRQREEQMASWSSFSSFCMSRREAVLQFAVRLFIVYKAIMFLLPFSGRAASAMAYRSMLFAVAGNLLLVLKNEVGLPQFNTAYLQRFMTNIAAQYLFFVLIMYTSRRPYSFALGVLLPAEIAHIFWFGSQLLRRASPSVLRLVQGQVDKVLPLVLKYHSSIPEAVVHYSTLAEVVLGIIILVEVLTPNRNFVVIMFYWQYLQFRYMIDQSGGVQRAFGLVDAKLLSIVNHQRCPGFVRSAYMFIRSTMAKAAERPQPGQAPQPGGLGSMASSIASRCTIS